MTEHKRGIRKGRALLRRIPIMPLFLAGVLTAMAIVGLAIWIGQKAQTVETKSKAVEQELAPAKEQALQGRILASDIVTACANPTIVAELAKTGSSACQQAAQVQKQESVAPTDAQIYQAVSQWLATHPPAPGRPPTQAELLQAVTETLRSLGWPPTEDRIREIAVGYIADNPDDFKGDEGEKGNNATDAQVRAAVSAYCGQTPSPCAGASGKDGQPGAKGDQGVQGISFKSLQFVRNQDDACTAVLTLYNPADGTESVLVSPAGDAACPGGAPTTTPPAETTTTAPTPTG